HGVIKARFREPRLIRKEGKDELDQTPLLMANLRFGDEHLSALEKRRPWQGYSYGNQAHSHGRFLGRIVPAELSFRLPAWASDTGRGQEKQRCNPLFNPHANHACSLWFFKNKPFKNKPFNISLPHK